LKQGC
jgi:hypothetical protein